MFTAYLQVRMVFQVGCSTLSYARDMGWSLRSCAAHVLSSCYLATRVGQSQLEGLPIFAHREAWVSHSDVVTFGPSVKDQCWSGSMTILLDISDRVLHL